MPIATHAPGQARVQETENPPSLYRNVCNDMKEKFCDSSVGLTS